jgi:hypothetical protein
VYGRAGVPRLTLLFPFIGFVVATTVTLCVPIRARADGRTWVFRWSAPGDCPDKDVVEARVRALAGPGAELDADATLTSFGGRFHAVLKVRTGTSVGERELQGESCAELVQSVAVVLALSATTISPPDPTPPRASPPIVAPSPSPPPQPWSSASHESALPQAARPRAPFVRITPVATVDVGTLPTPAFGGGADVLIAPGHGVTLGIAGAAWATGRGSLPNLGAQGAKFGLLTADARACYAVIRRVLELAPCAVLELARVTASGFGEVYRDSSTATWTAVGLGVRGRWEISGHFALALELGGIVPTQGQSFVVEQGGTVHVLGPVAFRGYFGPEVRF